MVKVWGRTTSSNVQKVLWACAEMNIPFERIDAGLHFGRTRDPEYLTLNPNGLVPTIEDGKAIVWESNTILRYLANKRGTPLYPTVAAARSQVERWMDWQLSVLGPPMGTLLMGYYRTPPERRDAAALDTAHTRAIAAWRILENQLKDGKPYVVGKDLTLADISLGMFVHRWYSYPVERPYMPHLRAWYDRLGTRPAYKTHIMIPVS